MYRFTDKTGKCFKVFQGMGNPNDEGDRRYHDHIGAMLRASHNGEHDFSVGDAMVFREELLDAGFGWGIDFYMKKV